MDHLDLVIHQKLLKEQLGHLIIYKQLDYTVCLTTENLDNYKQCFNVVITEPQDLSVTATVDDDDDYVNFKFGGSDQYYINLNNDIITTDQSDYRLMLEKG